MSHSLISAGRGTHLKILGVGLAAASLFVIVGLSARAPSTEHAVVKAETRSVYAGTEAPIRR